jgi:hypothetical protein
MSWAIILFIVLAVALVASAPLWPYNRSWGPVPAVALLVATILVGLKAFGAI